MVIQTYISFYPVSIGQSGLHLWNVATFACRKDVLATQYAPQRKRKTCVMLPNTCELSVQQILQQNSKTEYFKIQNTLECWHLGLPLELRRSHWRSNICRSGAVLSACTLGQSRTAWDGLPVSMSAVSGSPMPPAPSINLHLPSQSLPICQLSLQVANPKATTAGPQPQQSVSTNPMREEARSCLDLDSRYGRM